MPIDTFFANNPLVFHIIIVLASLLIIVKSADYLVLGITDYAKKLGLSDYIVGMIVIALAASVPELVSSIMGIAAAESGIIFGTILGSNISGICLVLGIFALIGRKINLKSKVLDKVKNVTFIFSLVPFLLVIDNKLSRLDGVILVVLYFIFVGILWKKEGELGTLKDQIKLKKIYKDALLFLLALGAILLCARWLVFSSIETSSLLGLTPYYISLVVIGIGASIPDLTVGIRAILAGHLDVGIGDSLGSMLIKSLLFLGAIAIIKPLTISFNLILVAIIFSIIIRAFVYYFIKKGSMNWKHGIFFILLYIAFIIIESLRRGV